MQLLPDIPLAFPLFIPDVSALLAQVVYLLVSGPQGVQLVPGVYKGIYGKLGFVKGGKTNSTSHAEYCA